MKVKKSILLNILIALAISTCILFLSEKGFLNRFNLVGLDTFFRLRGPVASNPAIVVVEIDDENITKVGRWPWQRRWHAGVIEALNAFGAKLIYFDIIFSETSSEEDDTVLSQAIRSAGNVYLPFVFQTDSTDIDTAFFPIPEFASYLKGTGSINIYPDIDGTQRRIPLYFESPKGKHLHVVLQLAMDYTDAKLLRLDRKQIAFADAGQTTRIPLIEGDKLLINWQDKWVDSFVHFSFLDVLQAYQSLLKGEEPGINVAPLKDSICIVGVTAIGLYDIRPIPLEPTYPGVGIIATTISNILDKNFIRSVPWGLQWFFIYLLGLIPALSISGEKSVRESLLSALCGVAFFVISFLIFKKNIWINVSLPLLTLFASYLALTTYNLVRVSVERKSFFELAVTDELTHLYNIRYFKMILRAECLIAKTDENRRFCIIMGDVDHFKSFNDTYGHQVGDLVLREVAEALKITVRSSDVVARYGGEEMVILLRGANLENGLAVAEKLRKSVESRVVKDESNAYKVAISLGVATFRSSDTEESVIKRADSGLYKAKNAGRNRVATEEKGVDAPTGLSTKDLLIKVLTAECAMAITELDKKFSLVLCQVDKVEDLVTSTLPDKTAKEVTAALRSSVRSSDTVARFDKDRVALLLNGAPMEDGLAVADKIRKKIEDIELIVNDKSYKITISLGVASFRRHDNTEILVQRAEESLSRARDEGGNRTCAA